MLCWVAMWSLICLESIVMTSQIEHWYRHRFHLSRSSFISADVISCDVTTNDGSSIRLGRGVRAAGLGLDCSGGGLLLRKLKFFLFLRCGRILWNGMMQKKLKLNLFFVCFVSLLIYSYEIWMNKLTIHKVLFPIGRFIYFDRFCSMLC